MLNRPNYCTNKPDFSEARRLRASKMSALATVVGEQQRSETEKFTNIPLEQGGDAPKEKKKKQPRRILHFSDGILEEYSTDEDEVDTKPKEPQVDPKTLTWMPWIWYYMIAVSSKTFSAAEACGEKLAWFFGITTPKYQYAIDEYYRLKEEEEKEKKKEEEQMSSVSTIDVQIVDQNKDNHPSVPDEPPLKY